LQLLTMAWRIFETLGLYSAGEYSSLGHLVGESVLPLDPILVAGRAKVDIILDWARFLDFKPCLQAIKWLSNIDDLLPANFESNRRAFVRTLDKFADHLRQLSEWEVLMEITHDRPRLAALMYISVYFAIPKDKEVARSIFNGKALSQWCTAPPAVNLPEVTDIIRRLAILVSRSSARRPFSGFTADIRHWFHQIPVGSEVSKYFGVALGTRFFEWRMLPMGWSHSPYICQCLAWTILLFADSDFPGNRDGLDRARAELRGAEQLPQYVTLRNDQGEDVGFITLTYDNIGVFTIDGAIREALAHKVHSNFTKKAGVVLKELHDRPPRHVTLLKPPVDDSALHGFLGIEYLGVQYGVIRSARQVCQLIWRHVPSRAAEWEKLTLPSDRLVTARTIARTIGVILWHYTVTLTPLCTCGDLIDILRRTAVFVNHSRPQWDEVVPNIGLQEIDIMNRHLSSAITNQWNNVSTVPSTEAFMFTDAASRGQMGYVVLNARGEPLAVEAIAYPPGMQEAHIFLQEMHAAVHSIKACVRRFGWHGTRIHVGVDNSAVAFALRHMYSSNRRATAELCDLLTALRTSECTIDVILVVSADNPADDPSRGAQHLDPSRLERGWLALQNGIAGRPTASDTTENVARGVRHLLDGGMLEEDA
jgi:hypothetical protein